MTEETENMVLEILRRIRTSQERMELDVGDLTYEIMSVDDASNVVIEVIYSGERVTCPLAEVLEDPMAETIP
ncbi:MAG: hypothetical protein E6G91_03735 [Alphaproteobacteria bacterium]|nr:MAG: hypothetical protein E6G91_03735 [Alphaproteobacteria bacterium]